MCNLVLVSSGTLLLCGKLIIRDATLKTILLTNHFMIVCVKI